MQKLPAVITALILSLLTSELFAAPTLTIANNSGSLTLDREELEALPQTTIMTTSPYFEGEVSFSGPALDRVVKKLRLSDETQLTFSALNDYRVSGDIQEILSLDAIIATRFEGETMSVRNRGPFWIILPLSGRPELDHENYHRYMVWQLNRIELE